MATGDELVVDVEGLRMRYGTRDVLHDVTFHCRRGEVLVVLGPNGAGHGAQGVRLTSGRTPGKGAPARRLRPT